MVGIAMFNSNPDEVRISDKELRTPGAPGIDVELIAEEEVDHSELSFDPRLTNLSPATRAAITQLFGGDVTQAEVNAHQICNVYAHPPAWALEVHGAHRSGWKCFDKARV